MIPTNAPVTLTYNGQAGSVWGLLTGLSPDDVATAIKTALRNYALAPVDVTCKVTGVLGNLIPNVTQPINGTITIRPMYEADADALVQAVANAITDATGYFPSVALTTIGDAADLDTSTQPSDLPQWLLDLLNEAKRDATWIAVGGVGLVALIVVAVAYGPNIKKLASVNL